ncbi:MAG: HD domain-containing protein [Opitutae bacterium]|nr:HD domain-containing protein [Opitutae bacterium]
MKLLNQFSDHQKSAVEQVTQLLKKHGAEISLVGGCVRDSLLGLSPKDIDIEVYQLTPEIIESTLSENFKLNTVGKNFGVYILKGYSIDISLPRKESKTGLKHTDFKISGDPYMHPKEAALRRDFSINAISYDLLKEELYDPFDGINDLSNKYLRHISPAFNEDPLRVLRAMQFIARFELSVDPKTLKLCQTLSPNEIPKERIWEEWKKLLLKGKKISLGLQFLEDCKWLSYFPELSALTDCEQDPEWHPEGNVWKHTKHCMDAFAQNKLNEDWEDLIVGLATLCHDMGKPKTTIQGDDGKIRSPQHDVEGVPIAKTFLARMTEQKKVFDEVLPLVSEHMRPHNLYTNRSSDAAIRRLANKVKRIDRLIRLFQADQLGRPPIKVTEDPVSEWLAERSHQLELQASAPKPIILGRHLIALNLKPSPLFKTLLKECFEAQLDGTFNNKTDGLNYLKSLLKKHKL